jgi:hypothetical protein
MQTDTSTLKKRDILNLIRYHAENNDSGFRNEAYDIARYFNQSGDSQLAEYIMALLSDANTFVPQVNENDLSYLKRVDIDNSSLPLPESIESDIIGVINAINHHIGINKFLFEGAPGTGKTETVKQIARILDRELFSVQFDTIIDSRLGQTSKNIAEMFKELKGISHPEKVIVLFDEIDAIALDRVNSNDHREMGRVTSSILREMDNLNGGFVLIATTNLFNLLDKALARRFDAVVDFNRYTRDDLVEVAESILNKYIARFKVGRNIKLFRKILQSMDSIPYPGDLENMIKTSLAFSNPNSDYDYLRKLYEMTNSGKDPKKLKTLQEQGFSLREIEILTGVSKSQASRKLGSK